MQHHGEAKAEEWLAGVKNNLARRPQGNDRAQVKAIKEGVCDLAVINHYYMGKMLSNPDQKAWADSVYIIFPNQAGHGTHLNVMGYMYVAYTAAKCHDKCVGKWGKANCGGTCPELVKKYQCAVDYCPTCKWAGEHVLML